MNKTTHVHGDYVNSIFQFGYCMNPRGCFFGHPSKQTGWKMQDDAGMFYRFCHHQANPYRRDIVRE